MDDIFVNEEKIIEDAEMLIKTKSFSSIKDQEYFENLLNEYKKNIKQIRRVVKISDIMQKQLSKMSQKLEKISNIDELTNIYNRRFFNEMYNKEWLSAVRTKTSISLLMIDIDHFKRYNDTYGHLQGDKCLQKISKTIQQTIKRPRDIVARYGGEEFVVLLPESDVNGGCVIAKEIIKDIENLKIPHNSSCVSEWVTVSVGVAAIIPTDSIVAERLINIADEALYRAKGDGRNCYRKYIMKDIY